MEGHEWHCDCGFWTYHGLRDVTATGQAVRDMHAHLDEVHVHKSFNALTSPYIRGSFRPKTVEERYVRGY